MKQLFLSVWICLFLVGWAHADIAQPRNAVEVPSRMDMRVEITNLAEFPGIQFYLSVPVAEDPNGAGIWQQFVAGKWISLSGDHGAAYLVAHKGDLELTANEIIQNTSIKPLENKRHYILDQKIKVTKVDDGQLEFQVLSSKVISEKIRHIRPERIKPAKGSLESLGWLPSLGLPLACLLGLLAFFIFRRKPRLQ